MQFLHLEYDSLFIPNGENCRDQNKLFSLSFKEKWNSCFMFFTEKFYSAWLFPSTNLSRSTDSKNANKSNPPHTPLQKKKKQEEKQKLHVSEQTMPSNHHMCNWSFLNLKD